MASVQPPPGIMLGGSMAMPSNISSQHLQEVIQKYKHLRATGVHPDDPEYVEAHTLLSAITQQQNYMKQKQLYSQQQQRQPQGQHQAPQQMPPQMFQASLQQQQPQQQQQQQQQQNGHIPSGFVHLPNGQAQSELPNQPNSQSGTPPTPQRVPGGGSFTMEQVTLLRNQILAFKTISKNIPIPVALQHALFPQKRQSSVPSQLEAASGSDQNNATAHLPDSGVDEQTNGKKPTPGKHIYLSYSSPYKLLKSNIRYADHKYRSQRPLIPSLVPEGVDADRMREEQERIIYNRIQCRKAELEKIPATIGSSSSASIGVPEDNIKLKALIEYKQINLLAKQNALRQQMSQELLTQDNLAMSVNRSTCRRPKRLSIREAAITERLERQQRDARETKQKKRQTDYLQSILDHGQNIQTQANEKKTRLQKLGRMMQQHHQWMEKEEQRRIERTAKQRLQALKANDEETYLKLLGQAKDSRISHLLQQTDGFLKQLAASVKQQQRNAAERYGDDDGYFLNEENVDEEEDEDDEGGAGKIDYYAVAHRIKEEVKEQPEILVGGTLKEYQLKGLQWMISLYNNNLNGILADEMGLGKTIQTISLITYLIEKKGQTGPFLVIVPLSTLTNWNLEFEKWAPSVTRVVYKGPPAVRKQQQHQIRFGNFQVLLTTYEYIIKDRPVLSKVKWVHMIVDEGHRMKNAQSKLSSTLTQYYTTRYRLILTGTPLQNNLPELWALLNFVLPTIFKSVKSFDEWFNTPFANTGGQDKMELSEEEQLLVIRRLHKVLRPFLLRRLKKDVEKDLPDKQERVIKCRFSALQAKLYKQLVTHNKMVVSDGKGGRTGMRGLSNMLMQLRKLCNHPFVFEQVEDEINPGKLTNDLIWRTAGKFELLDRILPKFRRTGHRVLMFFQMTQIMNIMEDFLRFRGLQYLRLDGSTKSDDRSDLLKKFNAPGSPYFCFLLSTRAGGLGLNLQTADTVIIYDSDWNPHQDLQAQDRAHRIGQKNEVRILRLISSNSVEEKILERAQFKLDMDGKVIQAGKFDNKSTNEERDALLRTLLESAEAADNAGGEDEMDDDDLNKIMARSEGEEKIFQDIDKERIAHDDYGPDKEYARIMGESELPEIYLNEDQHGTETPEEDHYGRGARERKVMRYDDGLSEEAWLRAVDDDEDTIEAAVARREAKLERRRINKERKMQRLQGIDSESPEPSRESSEAPSRKRGRKPSSKRKAEEVIDDAPVKRKRGRGKNTPDPLTVKEREILQKCLDNVYDTLMDLEVSVPSESDNDENLTRLIIDPFLEPPPKSQYPDYYMLIKKPIAMDIIGKRINKKEYTNLREFKEDIFLMCSNCRTYNEDGSMLFQDANEIEAFCVKKLRDEVTAHPEFAFDIDDISVVDGQTTTAGTSSVGTPVATSGSGQKLRLTFKDGATTNGEGSKVDSDEES